MQGIKGWHHAVQVAVHQKMEESWRNNRGQHLGGGGRNHGVWHLGGSGRNHRVDGISEGVAGITRCLASMRGWHESQDGWHLGGLDRNRGVRHLGRSGKNQGCVWIVISVVGRNQDCVWMVITVVGRNQACVGVHLGGRQESGLCVDGYHCGQ